MYIVSFLVSVGRCEGCFTWPGNAGCKYHYQCLHGMEYKDEFWKCLCVHVFEHHCLESVRRLHCCPWFRKKKDCLSIISWYIYHISASLHGYHNMVTRYYYPVLCCLMLDDVRSVIKFCSMCWCLGLIRHFFRSIFHLTKTHLEETLNSWSFILKIFWSPYSETLKDYINSLMWMIGGNG